jgi:hypothetical protein
MDITERQQRIMGLLHAIATKGLEMQETGRESYLQSEKREQYNDAIKVGMAPERATDVAERMDEWARALIRMIQTGGGAAGGRA